MDIVKRASELAEKLKLDANFEFMNDEYKVKMTSLVLEIEKIEVLRNIERLMKPPH